MSWKAAEARKAPTTSAAASQVVPRDHKFIEHVAVVVVVVVVEQDGLEYKLKAILARQGDLGARLLVLQGMTRIYLQGHPGRAG